MSPNKCSMVAETLQTASRRLWVSWRLSGPPLCFLVALPSLCFCWLCDLGCLCSEIKHSVPLGLIHPDGIAVCPGLSVHIPSLSPPGSHLVLSSLCYDPNPLEALIVL